MFAALCVEDRSSIEALVAIARDFTPRWERRGPSAVALDLAGLERLFGHPRAIADELRRAAGEQGVRASVAMAGTCTAAHLLAICRQRAVGSRRHEHPVVIAPGGEASALAPLPIDLLAVLPPRLLAPLPPCPRAPLPPPISTFHRWGLRTLGALAALPADAVAARLGAEGVRWQRLARGEDLRPLTPEAPEERFEQAIDLDWPIEGLEPLSFVLGRLLEPLAAHLERRGRGAAAVRLQLQLVTRTVHERSLQLPAPMRDVRALRTLLLLDLESHPPGAGIDRVVVAVDPTPARVLQFSLLTRPLPSPERLSMLMARLSALMGEGRCGSPAVVDTWQPGAFAVRPFAPRDHEPQSHRDTEKTLNRLCDSVSLWPVAGKEAADLPAVALRRFRVPIPARVRVEGDRPVSVTTYRRELPGGSVRQCAGPWRTSGAWWLGDSRAQLPTPNSTTPNLEVGVLGVGSSSWDRDEWDVALGDGSTCRLVRDRAAGAWCVEGIYD